jgi:hypothetical protein
MKVVSLNPGVQSRVQRRADHLDLNHRLRPRVPRQHRRSRVEALDEAMSRWQFRFDDPADDRDAQ